MQRSCSPEHDAALATEPAPVSQLHGQVADGLARVEGKSLILTICKQQDT
jgi:hypothetical protein